MYKKLLLVVLSGIALQTAKAQTEKGTQNLGFSVAFNSNKSTTQNLNVNPYSVNFNVKQTSFTVAPTYSYFVSNNLDLGASFNYTNFSVKYDGTNAVTQEQSQKAIGGTLFLRKYFLYENKIGVRVGPSVSYSRSKQRLVSSGVGDNSDFNTYGGAVQLDFVYFPVKKIGLAAGLGNISYSKSKSTDSSVSSDAFNASFVNNLSLSVYYVFGK